MNEKTKIKALITIIVFLLITNIAMLVFFIVLDKPANKRIKKEPGGMYTALQKDVGFSQDQLDQYQALRKKQMDKVRPLFNDVRTAKKNFYELIYSPAVSDSAINADADSIGQKQKFLDIQMFNYFNEIRRICRPDQTEKFDSAIKKVVMRMVSRPGGGHDKK